MKKLHKQGLPKDLDKILLKQYLAQIHIKTASSLEKKVFSMMQKSGLTEDETIELKLLQEQLLSKLHII